MDGIPETRYARADDGVYLAYQVFGEGDIDLVIVNGFNVYPREVEQVLSELPGVADAAVVGVPDERTGEAVKAVLVRAEGAGLAVDEVLAHCAERLARFKVPSVVEFVDMLPRTPTGKVQKFRLREMARGFGSAAAPGL